MGGVTAAARPQVSPYAVFDRDSWRALAAGSSLPLDATQLESLASLGDRINLDEVATVYLPLAGLLRLHVEASRRLWAARSEFLGDSTAKVPYVIAVAGSVAVGKSTTSRLLQTLLAAGPGNPRVDLVTTDGFLLPNAELERRGLMARKGFPESYDRRALLKFVSEVKAGGAVVTAPVYSHLVYDIVPGERAPVHRPDILLLEGLNVLQPAPPGRTALAVSDFIDFSVYVDAAPEDIRRWYVHRFLRLRETAFRHPDSYFRRYAGLDEAEAVQRAESLWDTINGPNLRDNIEPTRGRATLVLRKGPDHTVTGIRLRKV
jgi:type I pantothenate kinase